jgi:hypothetical protein
VDGGDGAARRHVAGCERCAAAYARIEAAAALTRRRLGAPPQEDAPYDATLALHKFKAHTERKTQMTEFGKSRMRPALAAGMLALTLLAAFAITPVRTAALGLFDVFRVEKFAAVTVDVSRMPMKLNQNVDEAELRQELESHRAEGPNPNVLGTYSGPMKPEKARQFGSIEEAGQAIGSDLADAGPALAGRELKRVYATEPVRSSYTFDTEKIRAKMKEAGVQGVRVPQQIDGKTFTFNIPQGVFVQYGSDEDGAVFAQGKSPSLSIPEGVNMDYLRQDFLMVPGLPQDLVAQVQAIEDWEHTLIIPLPPGGSSREVKIGRSQGLLLSDKTGEHNGVLWERGGTLYALGGKLSQDDVLNAARAVRYP